MREKRFTYDKPLVAFSKGGINDNVTGETYEFTMDTVLDLLNELNELNEELNKQVNNYHATFQSLLKTNLSLNNQLAETQKELKELYESLFPKPDLEHLNCRCSYEPNE